MIDKEHAEALSSGQWLGQDGKPKSKVSCDEIVSQIRISVKQCSSQHI